MQTVVVIPILPHGVVQLGSSLAIAENIGFVNYVKSLILQLGCVPGALQPDSEAKESTNSPGVPVSNRILASADSSGTFKVTSSTPLAVDGCNQQSSSPQPSRLDWRLLGSLGRQMQLNTRATALMFHTTKVSQIFGKSHDDHCEQKYTPAMKLNLPIWGQQENGGVETVVIPSSSDAWLNQQASLYGSRHQSSAGCSSYNLTEQNLEDAAVQDHASNKMNESNGDIIVSSHLKMISGLFGSSFPTKYLEGSDLHGGMNSQINSVSIPYSLQNPHKLADINMYSTHLVGTGLITDSSSKDEAPLNSVEDTLINSHMLSRCCDEAHSLLDAKPTPNNLAPRKGRLDNDFFQALNNPVTHLDQHMLSGQIHGFVTDCQTSDYGNTSSNSVDAKFEDRCMRPPSGNDLLDNFGADFKKKLLIGKWNNLPADEQRMGEVNMSNLVESELSGLTKSLAKAGTMGSSSFQSGCSKDDGGNCSQTTSIYGSHISSWVEHGQSMRHNGSVSTAHSKKKDETTKSNRKRMIQDQVKELREIVPNGAKCSVDALLERTIKHMLFLQSVTKHSDKLKQTGESKITSKEGGLLSKDKFEGGATWSFEDGCMRPPSGDDLLDNLGADFKKKLLIGKWDNLPADEQRMGEVNMSNLVESELCGLTKSLAKAGTMGSSSFQSGCSKDDGGNRSQTTSIYGSHISSWVEHGQSMRHDGSVSTAHSKKKDETTKSNRKRMIQDQVKELREIVPNGAKCSIDALLEHTIKHMLFLQSVTKHADKLKKTGESKIISKEGGLLLKDKFEGGATRAFEVGLQSMVCPIIVEDLNPPRQLLVEMLCEERGSFLEIADLIRGLGLTVLKGVMEARNDKIWARFAVEANRDVTRMEIFMSLVRLLDQTVKGSTLANALTT